MYVYGIVRYFICTVMYSTLLLLYCTVPYSVFFTYSLGSLAVSFLRNFVINYTICLWYLYWQSRTKTLWSISFAMLIISHSLLRIRSFVIDDMHFKYWQRPLTNNKKKRKHICTDFYIRSKSSFWFSWHDSPQRARTSSLSRLHDHTQTYIHSAGLLSMSDQPDAETPTWQHTTLTRTEMHASGGIRTRNPSNRAAADPRLRACGHWDGQPIKLCLVQRNIEDETLTNILAKSRT